jgi:hypothetical protein
VSTGRDSAADLGAWFFGTYLFFSLLIICIYNQSYRGAKFFELGLGIGKIFGKMGKRYLDGFKVF